MAASATAQPCLSAPLTHTDPTEIRIVRGYIPGILGRTVQMHLDYYHKANSWGRIFEVELSNILSDILSRLDNPVNDVWAAIETPLPAAGGSSTNNSDERIVGTVWLDGEAESEPGHGRLRAFIVEGHVRGRGVGRRLLAEAMKHTDETGLQQVTLTTMRSLTSARRLYEQAGFVEVSEAEAVKWGESIREMKYAWNRPRELCSGRNDDAILAVPV